MTLFKQFINLFTKNRVLTQEKDIQKLPSQEWKDSFEISITKLIQAHKDDIYHQSIYHNNLFYKAENETSVMIEQLDTTIEKPEYLHYNTIIKWYKDNFE